MDIQHQGEIDGPLQPKQQAELSRLSRAMQTRGQRLRSNKFLEGRNKKAGSCAASRL
jgi:hypothetical protein